MSAATDNAGHAFPLAFPDASTDNQSVQYGMTLRDYFAARAMPVVHEEYRVLKGSISMSRADYVDIAADAYVMADAMLKARQK